MKKIEDMILSVLRVYYYRNRTFLSFDKTDVVEYSDKINNFILRKACVTDPFLGVISPRNFCNES